MNPITVRYIMISSVKSFPEYEVLVGFVCPNCRKIHYKTVRDNAPLFDEVIWTLRCGVVHVVLPWKDGLPIAGLPEPNATTEPEPEKEAA
jgi:hypothetical protein